MTRAAARGDRSLLVRHRCSPQAAGARRRRADCAASTGSSASTTPSSTRGSTRSTPSCGARARPAPRGGLRGARRDRAVVAHPARSRQPRARRRVLDRGRARDRAHRGLDGAGARTTPRPGSTSAAPTPRACSGACCATRSWPRRATASASSTALERAIALDPTLDDAYFGDGDVQVLRRRRAGGRARCCASCCCCPAATAKDGLEQMLRARTRGTAAAGRGRLPAAHHLSLVRAADRRARSSCSRRCDEQYPGNPLFPAQIAASRTHTSTTSPRASRPGGRCWPRRASSASNAPVLAETQARLGIARHARGLHQTDHAIEQLAGGDRAAARRRRSDRWRSRTCGSAKPRSARRRARAASRRTARGTAAAPSDDPHDVSATADDAHAPRARCQARRGVPAARSRAGGGSRRTISPAPAAALERSLALNGDAIRSRATGSAACCRR